MTDPLRPLVDLITSVARTRGEVQASGVGERPAAFSASPALNSSGKAPSLINRLATRLAEIERDNRQQRRKVFVEIALLSELGNRVAVDPGFNALVDDVCTVLATDERAITALDHLLDSVSGT